MAIQFLGELVLTIEFRSTCMPILTKKDNQLACFLKISNLKNLYIFYILVKQLNFIFDISCWNPCLPSSRDEYLLYWFLVFPRKDNEWFSPIAVPVFGGKSVPSVCLLNLPSWSIQLAIIKSILEQAVLNADSPYKWVSLKMMEIYATVR